MLAARPAVVLAALTIRIGLKPVVGAASAAMLFWHDKWNNLEVHETCNSSCLGLLLDADSEYRKQINDGNNEVAKGLLLNSSRELFSRLVDYKHAEANLLATLTANIGWTPEKTHLPAGPVVKCCGCGFPRSVTIVAERTGGKCGICAVGGWRDAAHRKNSLNAHITKEDTESSDSI